MMAPGDAERAVLDYALAHPQAGVRQIAAALADTHRVSKSCVHKVLQRHGLGTVEQRVAEAGAPKAAPGVGPAAAERPSAGAPDDPDAAPSGRPRPCRTRPGGAVGRRNADPAEAAVGETNTGPIPAEVDCDARDQPAWGGAADQAEAVETGERKDPAATQTPAPGAGAIFDELDLS